MAVVTQLSRFVINGLAATAVHYGVLSALLQGLNMPSAGGANLIASVFGIGASFLGNRHFVFRHHHGPAATQARRFLLLYAAMAALHGTVMGLMTDVGGVDFRISFVVATGLQTGLSYAGNKWLVFRS